MAIQKLILGVDQSTYEESAKSGSKFASVGLHLAEIQPLPNWKTANKSIFFPFVIIEEGTDDTGKVGELTAGVDPDIKDANGKVIKRGGIWKFAECIKALGIGTGLTKVKNKAGQMEERVEFDPSECLGKQVYVEYVETKDERTAEEGGKGTVYTKPVRFWSLADGAKKLGNAAPPVDL